MIQWMLAISSLVPLPFPKPAWASEYSWFTYRWSLACRIFSITSLECSEVKWSHSVVSLSNPVDCSLPGLSFHGILQARLQQYTNHELPEVQAGFREGRGTRDQTTNIRWSSKKQEFQKSIYFCFIDYAKAFVWITINCGKFWKRWDYQATWLDPEKSVCNLRCNN